MDMKETIKNIDRELFDTVWKIALIIILTSCLIFAFVRYDVESVECLRNPFVFGAQKIGEKYDSGIQCECLLIGDDIQSELVRSSAKKFVFTDEGFNQKPKITSENNPLLSNLNWSQ